MEMTTAAAGRKTLEDVMIRFLPVVAVLLSLVPSARADQDACTAAMERICPQSRGDILLMGCLRTHHKEVSAACKGDLAPVLKRAEKFAKDCDHDIKSVCKDVAPGDGRVAHCLHEQESHLTAQCQGAFNTWRLAKSEFTGACWGDIGKFCKTLPEGSGRIWGCLKKHDKELADQCKDAMAKL